MKTSSYPEITDELLSAYIDNAVSDVERAFIEQAVREDTTVAWRLATLRETVNLLRTMPVLQAPRSFTLTAEQLGQPVRTPALVPGVLVADQRAAPDVRPSKPAQQSGRWTTLLERWRGFWQTGSPVWRNAMAASMAILLVMVIAPAFLGGRTQVVDQMAAPVALVREVAPAAESLAASDAEAPATTIEQDAPSALKITATDESAPLATAAIDETPAGAEAVTAGAAMLQEESAGQPAPPVELTVNEEPVTAMEAAQPPGMAAARGVAPSPRTDDPLNPLPPAEESAAADSGVASAEIAGAALAPAPLQNLEMDAPVIVASEESASHMLISPAADDETTASATELADADGIVPEPVATSDAAAVQPTAMQETVVAPVAQPEGEAELHRDSAAPPARDVASVGLTQLLPWFQLALLGAVVVFGLLWQRSRRNA